jgi:uncharacterized membrane protein (DUF441 family)
MTIDGKEFGLFAIHATVNVTIIVGVHTAAAQLQSVEVGPVRCLGICAAVEQD